MIRSKGKRAAVGMAALALVLMAGASLVCWEPLAERWYLYRLERGTDDVRLLAARRLGEMQSRAAVVPLLRLVAGNLKAPQGAMEGSTVTREYLLNVPTFLPPAAIRELKQQGKASAQAPMIEPDDLVAMLKEVTQDDAQPEPLEIDLLPSGIIVTTTPRLHVKLTLVQQALFRWYFSESRTAPAREALAAIGERSAPELRRAALHREEHPGVRTLAAVELLRLGP